MSYTGGRARHASGEVTVGCDLATTDVLVLDSDAQTTLAAEYLLNAKGQLEIVKTFKCAKTVPIATVCLRAGHANNAPYDSLIRMSVTDLRAEVDQLGLRNKCSMAENPSMRAALYGEAGDLGLWERLIRIADAKDVWSRLHT